MLTSFSFDNLNILISFPAPKVPPVEILPDIIGNVINISIVSFAINISMAKLFAKKYKYELDSNQVCFEMNQFGKEVERFEK